MLFFGNKRFQICAAIAAAVLCSFLAFGLFMYMNVRDGKAMIVEGQYDIPRKAESDPDPSALTTKDIVRSLVPIHEVDEDASLDDLLDRGRVSRWVGPIRVFFSDDLSDVSPSAGVLEDRLNAFLRSISAITELQIEQVSSLAEADIAILISSSLVTSETAISTDELIAWFLGERKEPANLREYLQDENSICFRVASVDVGRIIRGIGFMSTDTSQSEQERCLSKVFLYILGLQGQANSHTAKLKEDSALELGPLDIRGLKLIYNSEVEPGMALREAVQASTDRDHL